MRLTPRAGSIPAPGTSMTNARDDRPRPPITSVEPQGYTTRTPRRPMPTNGHFELFLFTRDVVTARAAAASGIDGFVIDWESRGKDVRQQGADTEINHDTPDDLKAIRACTSGRVLCRLNSLGEGTPYEVDLAIAGGADEILLPMVRTVGDVEHALELVGGRCRLGILVETDDAVKAAPALGRLPLSRIYVGLNDLAIDRGSRNIFTALCDGTVEHVRAHARVPFGVAGLTLPDHGFPIPCRLLVGELARLDCSFTFLRRSFRRDIRGRDMRAEVPRMRDALRAARQRAAAVVAREHAELEDAVDAWAGASAS